MTEDIQKACEIMQAGGIILYPTDTIWGIGCYAGIDRQFGKTEHVRVGYARYSLGPDRSGR